MKAPPQHRLRRHVSTIGLLATAGTLTAVVVPEAELEANKPKVEYTKSGTNFILDWEAKPNVYYFVEGSPDLVNWLPAKLLKDNAESGSLSLGTAINLSKPFFRLSLEGDPNLARMRADDGDGIINLLEANAGWDAFLEEDPLDREPDGQAFHCSDVADRGDSSSFWV